MTKIQSVVLKLVGVVLIFALAFFLAREVGENAYVATFVSSYGYIGLLVLSFISGLNLIVPIPAVSFFPLFLEAGLNPVLILLFMSLGMTLADSVAYLLGRVGREVAQGKQQSKIVAYLDGIRNRYYHGPLVALFLFASFAPFPNEVLVIPLSFMGYQLRLILPLVFIGNIIFNTITAFGVLSIWNGFF